MTYAFISNSHPGYSIELFKLKCILITLDIKLFNI